MSTAQHWFYTLGYNLKQRFEKTGKLGKILGKEMVINKRGMENLSGVKQKKALQSDAF